MLIPKVFTSEKLSFQLLSDVEQPEDIVQRALQLVENNDIEGGQLLFSLLQESAKETKDNRKMDAFIHTLMFNDHAAMAKACFSQKNMESWLLSDTGAESDSGNQSPNLTHFLHHCPKLMGTVLARLRPPTRQRMLQRFTPEQVEEAMAGRSSIAALNFMVSELRGAPTLWREIDCSWLGKEGSSLRQQTIGLGWDKAMVPTMMETQIGSVEPLTSIAAWSHVVQCPYSLYLLHTCLNNGPQQRAYQKILDEIAEDEKANPMDIALVRFLATKIGHPMVGSVDFPFRAHPNVPELPKDELCSLLGLVNTYIALGTFSEFQELILSGGLGQMQSMHTDESFDIPELSSP